MKREILMTIILTLLGIVVIGAQSEANPVDPKCVLNPDDPDCRPIIFKE